MKFKTSIKKLILIEYTVYENHYYFDKIIIDGYILKSHIPKVQIEIQQGYSTDDKTMRVCMIEFHLDDRGKGFGTAVMQAIQNFSIEQNCKTITGMAENEDAKNFFEKAGFSFKEDNMNFYKEIILIKKPLLQNKITQITNLNIDTMNNQIERQIDLLREVKAVFSQHSQIMDSTIQGFNTAIHSFEQDDLNHDYMDFIEEFFDEYKEKLMSISETIEDEYLPALERKIRYLEERE